MLSSLQSLLIFAGLMLIATNASATQHPPCADCNVTYACDHNGVYLYSKTFESRHSTHILPPEWLSLYGIVNSREAYSSTLMGEPSCSHSPSRDFEPLALDDRFMMSYLKEILNHLEKAQTNPNKRTSTPRKVVKSDPKDHEEAPENNFVKPLRKPSKRPGKDHEEAVEKNFKPGKDKAQKKDNLKHKPRRLNVVNSELLKSAKETKRRNVVGL